MFSAHINAKAPPYQRQSLSIPPVSIGQHLIEASEFALFLGVYLDSNLKFHKHITNIKKTMAYGLRILIKARPYFSNSTLISLYYAFIHPHISYCIVCWGTTYATHLKSLQIIQNQAIRIFTYSSYYIDAALILQDNNILSVSQLVRYSLGIVMYKLLNNIIFLPLIPQCYLVNDNITRFALNNNMVLPKVRTNYGKQAIHFSLVTVWNTIPLELKNIHSIFNFKAHFKQAILS